MKCCRVYYPNHRYLKLMQPLKDLLTLLVLVEYTHEILELAISMVVNNGGVS